MDYIEKITALARDYIDKAQDAGFGMFNFYITLPNFRQAEHPYEESVILQTYPYKENDYYGLVYILPYYPINDIDYDHDDIDFNDLTDEEKEVVYNAFVSSLK